MPFHHTHFPTFTSFYHSFREWYGSLRFVGKFAVNFVVTGAIVLLLYWIFLSAPPDFPRGAYVRVPQGASLQYMAETFEDRAVVRNGFLFKLAVRALGDHRKIPAGEYYFPQGEGLVQVAIRLVSGDFNTTPVRITVPEGATNREITALLAEQLPEFDIREFIAATKDKEGYLFPDTYFFMPGESTEGILSVFNNGLQTHLQKIESKIEASGKTLHEVLTMASILEKEAAKLEDRKLISGVLWHRIDIGMLLQVDAVFPYYLGRNTFEVTIDDLKEDHPYNTYVNKGLPPGPIGNPSLDAILAAVEPTPNNYVYFLSDLDGNFHFANTYEQHLANKARYLD
ncbi:endolytic transglycosylase MltG [Candidatus Nomurabacteria bacterium]|nr:endolytic transglycosylase MltG [Candidatus Nomurabacteria bacterium]